MELPILIEPLPDRAGYSARLGDPFDLHAEAATPEQARAQLALLLPQRLQQGARLGTISIPITSSSAGEGWLVDDELTREWLVQAHQFQRECDEADRRQVETAEGKEAS